uniref:Uncharacterized protein n=1 Tax=Photinus pyralis TaxID=7054 RepID=A0A1Y1LJF4_PHOPY
MASNKRYVNWKKLISFGFVFWVLLCSFDTFFVDPLSKLYCISNDDEEIDAPISTDDVIESVSVAEEIQITAEKSGIGWCLFIWNAIAFVTTIMACIGLKLARNWYLLSKNNETRAEISTVEEADRKSSVSKIPVLTAASRSTVNLDGDKDFFLKSSTFTDLSVRSSRSEMTSKYMEKQCSKLRDDMIAMQALSLKEHNSLSRKLESMAREKRELCRQLMLAHKENRAAKQQLEELLTERTLLLKRLDSATKEFKTNTKSKKTTLAKLEETQVTISNLLKEVERFQAERNEFQKKSRTLALENQQLKEHIVTFEDRLEREIASKTTTKEQKLDLEELNQSHKDVQKVQMRLLNLEQSLDKLQLSQWRKKLEEGKPVIQEESQEEVSNDKENESANFILTKAESPLEEQRIKSGKLKTGNLTDEQLEKFRIPDESSSDEVSLESRNFAKLMREVNRGVPFREISTLKSISESDVEYSYPDDRPCNETSTTPNEDEDSDEWEQYRCKISNSKAFKNFLQKMDHIDKLQTKLSVPM